MTRAVAPLPGDSWEIPITTTHDAWDKQIMLSLDGGELQSYSTLLILKELMRKITAAETAEVEEHGNSTKQELDICKPCHVFDYIFGSSVGGLLALMLGRLRMSIDECLKAYDELENKVFGEPHPSISSTLFHGPRNRKQAAERLKLAFFDIFDSNMELCAPAEQTKTAVFATQLGRKGLESTPYLFRSYYYYFREGMRPHGPAPVRRFTIRIQKVAMITCSAPSSFEPVGLDRQSYVDVSGFGTNLTYQALLELNRVHMTPDGHSPCQVVVSIGSELPLNSPLKRYATRFKTDYLSGTNPLSSSEDVHKHVETFCEKVFPKLPYYRFDPTQQMKALASEGLKPPFPEHKVSSSASSSSSSRRNSLWMIKVATERYIAAPEVQEQLGKLAAFLANSRRLRARDGERWEKFLGKDSALEKRGVYLGY